MKSNLSIITAQLDRINLGESAPAFETTEFRELLTAINEIAGGACSEVYTAVGRHAVSLVLDRLSGSMNAERALRVMRGQEPDRSM
jgi:hypothetical protein